MKKNIFLLLILILSCTSKAQGNLQFNRVVTFSNSDIVANNAVTTFETITIPQGKVWKIESVSLSGVSNNVVSPFDAGSGSTIKWLYARFNDVVAYSANNVGNQINLLPIWLNSGTYIFKVNSAYSNLSGRVLASYSAIEFNIIP